MPKNYAIIVYVDPDRLPVDEQGHIIEETSASYLKSWSDKLFLHELAGLTCYIDFRNDYSWIEGKKHLSELVGTEDESWLQPKLAELIKSQSQANQWASKIEIKSSNSSPFIAIHYHERSNAYFVEIHSEEVYSSSSTLEQGEERSRTQLTKTIRYKAVGGQYEKDSPFVIMVKKDISKSMLFDSDLDQLEKTNSIVEKELEKYP